MALLHPFQGYRFNREKVGDISLIVTQPYDKIPAEMQKDYYSRSPYNVVRVTLNLEKRDDPNTDYPAAGYTFQRWINESILIQDTQPAFYAYYQEYEIEGEKKLQKGFIALLDLKHAASGILPHERTLAEPKMDRLRLMRRLEANDDSIYMLYTEDKLAINHLLDEKTSQRAPDTEVKDDYGAIHRLWAITEPKVLKKIQDDMTAEELFIADGHHRFETSLNFMKECQSRSWKAAGTESFDHRIVTCFNSADKGLTILPTHRLIRAVSNFDAPAFLQSVLRHFDVEPAASCEELWEKMKRNQDCHVFGFYAGRATGCCMLRMKEEAETDPMMLARPEAYRQLDVSILHTLVLESLFGINEAKLVAQQHVDYARDRDICIRQVNKGKYQAAFFLNPTTVEQMQRIALLGEKMPQKSTDFYPKLLTGLLFMKMNIMKPL
jgi:uncharacterized protein (DUF1015 family)